MPKKSGKHRSQEKRKFIYRSSVTGKIVTKTYAVKNPRTTTKEAVK